MAGKSTNNNIVFIIFVYSIIIWISDLLAKECLSILYSNFGKSCNYIYTKYRNLNEIASTIHTTTLHLSHNFSAYSLHCTVFSSQMVFNSLCSGCWVHYSQLGYIHDDVNRREIRYTRSNTTASILSDFKPP